MIKLVIFSFAFLGVLHAAPTEDFLSIEGLISRLARQMVEEDSPKTVIRHMFSNVTREDLEDLRNRMQNMTSIAASFFDYTEAKVMNIMSKPKAEIKWKNLGEIPEPPETLTRDLHKLLFRCYVTTVKLFLFGLESGKSIDEICDPHSTDLDKFFGCVMEKVEIMSEMKSQIEFEIMEGFDSSPNHPFHVPQCDIFEEVCSMNEPRRQTACKGQHVTITCQYGTIAVKDANFEKSDDSDSMCPYRNLRANSIDCTPGNNKKKAITECDGKQSCTLSSGTDEFGDPCYDSHKYLYVEYCCSLRDFEDMRDAVVGHLACTRNVVHTLIYHVLEDIENEVNATIPIRDLMKNIIRRLAIAEMSTYIFKETVHPLRRLSDTIQHGSMRPLPFVRRNLQSLLDQLRSLTKKDMVIT